MGSSRSRVTRPSLGRRHCARTCRSARCRLIARVTIGRTLTDMPPHTGARAQVGGNPEVGVDMRRGAKDLVVLGHRLARSRHGGSLREHDVAATAGDARSGGADGGPPRRDDEAAREGRRGHARPPGQLHAPVLEAVPGDVRRPARVQEGRRERRLRRRARPRRERSRSRRTAARRGRSSSARGSSSRTARR